VIWLPLLLTGVRTVGAAQSYIICGDSGPAFSQHGGPQPNTSTVRRSNTTHRTTMCMAPPRR
jgi:hypothetical protein